MRANLLYIFRFFLIFSVLGIIPNCAKNPVTGQQELHLISTRKEIKMGEQNYLYAQQGCGGKYTVDPELSAYVQQVGLKLAKVSERPDLPFEFVVLNDSVPNAWALPGGKIAVNRGLLIHLHSEAELAAVLAHEITHAVARHGAKSMERQILLTSGLAAANAGLAIGNEDNRLTNDVLMAGAGVAAGLVSTKYSREAELQADEYGMEYMVRAGYDPMAAVSLQETFVKLMENKSPGWLEGLFASHPPSRERVKANLARAQKMPKHLALNKEQYQKKIGILEKNKLAYENYEKGLKAYKKGDMQGAINLANMAIQQEPKEALFYGLLGDAHHKQDNKEKALQAYDSALKLNNNYYYFYQQRGLLLEKTGKRDLAKKDLLASQALLPTKTVQDGLNRIG